MHILSLIRAYCLHVRCSSWVSWAMAWCRLP